MNFLKNIADRAKQVTDSPVSRANIGETSSPQEGFICPLCLESFDAPIALQQHFEVRHSEDTEIQEPPSPRFGSLGLRPEDVGGGGGTPQSDEEKLLFSNQVRALEESKTLLSNEVMLLRQELAHTKQENVPNERILERANELAAENVGLKAAIDESMSEKQSMEERIKLLEEQIQGRASRDDSDLLKQELVNIQKAMDDSLRLKENEMKRLKETYDELFYEKQQLVDSKEKQDKALIEAQHKLREVAEHNSNGSVSKEELEISDILKSEILILKTEINDLKTAKDEATDLVYSKNKEISDIKLQLETSVSLNAQLRKEADTVKVQVDELKVEIVETEKKMSDIDAQNNDIKKELISTQKVKYDLDNVVQSMQQKTEEIRMEKDRVKSEALEKENKIGELQRLLEEKEKDSTKYQQLIESKECDLERFVKEKTELLAKIEAGEGVNTAIDQLKAENKILQDKFETEKNQHTESDTKNSSMIASLNQLIGSLKIDLEKEKNAIQDKTEQLEEKEKINHDIQHKLSEADRQLKETTQKAEASAVESTDKMNRMEESLVSITKTLKDNVTEYEKLRITFSKTKEDLLMKDQALEETTNDLNLVKANNLELEKMCSTLKEKLLELNNELDKLREDLEASGKKSFDFEVRVKSLEDQNALDSENIKALKQAKAVLQEDKLRLENLVEDKTVELEEIINKVDSKESRINQLTAGLNDTEVKVKEMQKVLDEASGKELSLLSDIEQKRKEICEIQEEKASVVVHLESQQTILERLTNQKDVAEKNLRMSKLEIESLEEKVCQLQASIEKLDKSTKEEMDELRIARELLLSQVVDMKHEKENVSTEIEEERLKHKQAIERLEEMCHKNELSVDSLEKELKDEKTGRTTDQEKAAESLFALETKYNSGQDQIENLASEVFTLTSKVLELETERNAALSKTLELEAVVGSANEERRGLLERCVSAETETERSRNITLELRRKLEDAQAAVHELGRENQSIQVELAKQSGRKWKDDTDVVTCQGCQGGFSLTNRKHHCRNCGNIFCNECSNKQANMAGYKKPQRVCEGCFNELGTK